MDWPNLATTFCAAAGLSAPHQDSGFMNWLSCACRLTCVGRHSARSLPGVSCETRDKLTPLVWVCLVPMNGMRVLIPTLPL